MPPGPGDPDEPDFDEVDDAESDDPNDDDDDDGERADVHEGDHDLAAELGTEHGDHDPAIDEVMASVPLFPLPNVVLLPGAVLPLHVFEKRYRQMTEHLVGGGRRMNPAESNRLLAIVRIGAKFDPMDDQPPLMEVGCCGRILDAQRLDDGRWNILVKGLCRVRVGDELDPELAGPGGDAVLYRRADLLPLHSKRAFEIDLGEAREKMRRLCRRPPIVGTPVGRQLDKLLSGPIPTAQLADVLAFDLLEDVDEKQALLEETDVRRRVERLAHLLDEQFPEPDSIIKLSDRFQVDE